MKTLLFIGVLVAVISWSSALRCWQDCVLTEPGQKPDTDPPCEKKECPSIGKTMCARLITYIEKTTITALGCEQGEAGVCKEKKLGTIKTKTCVCDTELCNEAEIPKPETKPQPGNEAQSAGTSYIHLNIAFIVGAIFFH